MQNKRIMNSRDNNYLKRQDWTFLTLLTLNAATFLIHLFLVSLNSTSTSTTRIYFSNHLLFSKSIETVSNIHKHDIRPAEWSTELINGCSIIFQVNMNEN